LNFEIKIDTSPHSNILAMDPYLHHEQAQGAAEMQEQHDTPAAEAMSKEKHRQLFQRGLLWLGAGVTLMGLSFAINLLLFHSETSFSTTMYILTSLGAACMVKGLADIMGF
jgi:hypothetical protein